MQTQHTNTRACSHEVQNRKNRGKCSTQIQNRSFVYQLNLGFCFCMLNLHLRTSMFFFVCVFVFYTSKLQVLNFCVCVWVLFPSVLHSSVTVLYGLKYVITVTYENELCVLSLLCNKKLLCLS